MGLSTYCRNCGAAKDSDFYAENYCTECTSAVKEAREFAIRENQDIGSAQRSALAQRSHSTHRNRPDPRYPLNKSDIRQATDPNFQG